MKLNETIGENTFKMKDLRGGVEVLDEIAVVGGVGRAPAVGCSAGEANDQLNRRNSSNRASAAAAPGPAP